MCIRSTRLPFCHPKMQDAPDEQQQQPHQPTQELKDTEMGSSPQLSDRCEGAQLPTSLLLPSDTNLGVKVQLAEAHSRVYDAFSRAFNRQNTQFEKAIRSLDSLNDQIVEFFISSVDTKKEDDFPKQRLVLAPSVALMKKLLLDAQGKFRKMVEENEQLAARIDGELQVAHKEVDTLRKDLADTNRRIAEMQANSAISQRGDYASSKGGEPYYEGELNKNQPLTNGTEENERSLPRYLQDQIVLLREENDRLQERNSSLLREVDELKYLKDAVLRSESLHPDHQQKNVDLRDSQLDPKVSHLALELTHAKEALSALKADRKRLKAEKFDLLSQMKQLYATLEDKERELRDFIRNYEQRMKESDESVRQLASERDESEREKWNLLKHARDEAERAVTLAAQLGQKDILVKRLEDELEAVRKQMLTLGYCSDADSVRTNGPTQHPVFTPTCSPLPLFTPTPSVSTPTCSPLPLSNCTSTTNGRGSSADSGVRLSSDRDSTVSQEASSLTTAVERHPNGDSDGVSICSSTATAASSSHYYYYYYGCVPSTPSKDGSSTIYANPVLLRDESRSSLNRREDPTPPDSKNDTPNSSCTTPVNGTSDASFGHGSATSVAPDPKNGISNSGGTLSRSAEQLCERVTESAESTSKGGRVASMTLTRKGNKGGSTWGSISRVFARQKKRTAFESSTFEGDHIETNTEELIAESNPPNASTSNPSDKRASWSPGSSLCVSPLTEESYAEKLRLLEEAQHIPLERWKAHTVLAWLEITLGMPQYGAMCAENIRSGKVLLELSDSELETGLGITHIMHRKKLRLAIEELRDPRRRRFPKISVLDHTWVTSEWLPDLGLPQYAESFASNLIDGRLLDTLTKKDLEKHLSVSRKFHQASIINGVHLLRIFRFDRQLLAEKRRQCENIDSDPVVWTNYRWIKWARSIDLAEYAAHLKDSGVHGALVVLEHSFSSETMATALGIPSSKTIIRRHLATEFENLIIPARRQMEEQARFAKMEKRRQEKMASGGSLGRSFARTYVPLDKGDKDKRRASLRGSLSRALGLKAREEMAYQNGMNSSDSSVIYATPRGIPIHASCGPAPSAQGPHTRNGPYYDPNRYPGRPLPNPHSMHMMHSGSIQERPRSSVVPSSVTSFNQRENHRRVRSIGDIEHMTVTPV